MKATMLSRLRDDAALIEEAFGLSAGLTGAVVGSDDCLGDPHHGGQRVGTVTLRDGSVIVYKPRSVEPEATWAAIVDAVNEAGLSLPLWRPRTLARGDYGWVEYLPARPPTSADAAEFLARAGALLALLDVFEVRDAHRDNIVARGPDLALIDAETIVHPRFVGWGDRPSVLLTGFLPWRLQLGDRDGLFGQLDPSTLGPPQQLADAITDGYRAGYAALEVARTQWLAADGLVARLRSLRTRVVLRPTRGYLEGRSDQYPIPVPPDQAAAIEAVERVALARGDVPVFTTAGGGVDLESDGVRFPKVFPETGPDRVARRLASLSVADRDANLATIRDLVLVASLG